MPNLVEKDSCCGCAACANKCPKGAIRMQPNVEGFLHPVIDVSKCIECGACEKACPGLQPAQREQPTPQAYIVQHGDDGIRYQSTSGGAFTALAEEIIRQGGVVFGAVVTNEWTVRHEFVTDIAGLARFRNSKYVQSEIGHSYIQVKKLLKEGRKVCFSGTPCQINGLIKYLDEDNENLITVDVVCKSVPSPLVFQKYIEFKESKEGKITDVVFRDKKRGFLYCTMAHYLSHENRIASEDCYRRGSESDEWLRMFLSGKISRRSCFNCKYQTQNRVSDFTLGDIWETGKPDMDDNKGTTLVHVWSDKGRSLFEEVKQHVRWTEYPIEKSRGVERNVCMKLNSNRVQLFEDANRLSSDVFFKKYAPYTFKVLIKQLGRYIIWRMHLHNLIRHVKHLIIHRR